MIGSGGIYGSTTKPLVNHETIVIGRKGSAGSVFYSPTPCHPSDTTFYLVWKEEVHVPFVYNFLLFKGIAPDRSVIPSLQRGDVESIVIPFPPLPEQRAIAHILSAVQAAREARQREVSLERERKAASMAHLFTHGTRGEPTKQTPIGEMPVSWEMVTLGDAITLQRGFDLPAQDRKPGPFPGGQFIRVLCQSCGGEGRWPRCGNGAIRHNRTSFLRRVCLLASKHDSVRE